ncbi:hypothetical protein [Chromatium okenii]|nr:hypothetical protein [Chromatium okenii]
MSFRLPIEARDRMQRLMSIHNAPSQADVILMALDALESVAPAPAVSAQLDDVVTRIERMFDDMLARIDTMQQHFAAFEVRLSAIEAGAGESTIVEKAGADADVNDAGADKKRTRKTADFDPDVWIVSVSQISEDLQRECVQMLRNKIDKDDIVTMVETKIGKKMTRQFKNNFKTKSLESWVNLYPKTVHPKIEPHWDILCSVAIIYCN